MFSDSEQKSLEARLNELGFSLSKVYEIGLQSMGSDSLKTRSNLLLLIDAALCAMKLRLNTVFWPNCVPNDC